MFKQVGTKVWAFDAEWIPDPTAGRMLYDMADEPDDHAVMEKMWLEGGGSEDKIVEQFKQLPIYDMSEFEKMDELTGKLDCIVNTS
ncbi:MAG: hypothetical protein JKY89_08850, partial [Immundisolibacteraceae bacterium]|nr:hypothetical protein [Immundisolibacteraceae bacterium]